MNLFSKIKEDRNVFLSETMKKNLPKPSVIVSEEREERLLWEMKDLFLLLIFLGDGNYSYYGRSSIGDDVFMRSGVNCVEPLPKEVLNFF
jgi:hypothetical protein